MDIEDRLARLEERVQRHDWQIRDLAGEECVGEGFDRRDRPQLDPVPLPKER